MGMRRAEEDRSPESAHAHAETHRPQPRYFVIPRGHALTHELMDGRLRLEEMTHWSTPKEFDIIVVTAEPGVSCWEGRVPAAGRLYYVMEGDLEIVVGDTSYLLAKDDSIYITLDSAHIWRNPAKETTRMLMLSSPPTSVIETPGKMGSEA